MGERGRRWGCSLQRTHTTLERMFCVVGCRCHHRRFETVRLVIRPRFIRVSRAVFARNVSRVNLRRWARAVNGHFKIPQSSFSKREASAVTMQSMNERLDLGDRHCD